MKDFWSTGLASVKPTKASTAFPRVAQAVLSCPVSSASSKRQFSYSQKPLCTRKKHLIKQGFSTLVFMLSANKVKKTN